DYLSGTADYLYDDTGKRGGLDEGVRFVVMGDLNASPHEGESVPGAIAQLLNHPRITDPRPASLGARRARPHSPHSALHTASWGMRVDYVLPSSNMQVLDAGVFWPEPDDALSHLVSDRGTGSDHRLVWVDIHTHTRN
ncbi:MAG TPA: endonuclease/exonuclease/phosphatase family protein, partial [Cellvibrionaceae bacterium]